MDWGLFILLAIGLGALLVGLKWRPPSGRATTPEEVLEREVLRREQDQTMTDAVYRSDRYNTRP
jgi:hypothetical protein